MIHKQSAWRSNITFFVSLFLYWTLLSVLDRIAFYASNFRKVKDSSDALYAFGYGLKMDVSLSAYLLIIPIFFFLFQSLILKKAVSKWVLRLYCFFPTLLFAAITISNLPLYEAWGEKISRRAITLGIDTMGGVSSSVDIGMLAQAAFVLVIYFTCAHFFYHLVVVRFAKYRSQPIGTVLLSFLIAAVVSFTFIRGGYGRATLNPSSVYFSDSNVANHVAVNTYWAFLKDMTKSAKKNPYQYMDDADAKALLTGVLPSPSDSVLQVLNTKRPNVVLVILEGVVAQVFENLGGEKNVTPQMKKLMDGGISFQRAYAAADRSDKGMIAVMSGFPAQGPESIISYIPKHEKLAGIGQVFDSLGYSTSFYHGGESEFYNFKSYMYTHGINRVVDNQNFPLGVRRNSWGVYDHVIANRLLQDVEKDKKPFFSVFYTLVNHEPFHLDTEYKFGNDTKANAYRSTCFYTDSMLYNFVEKAKQQSWYDETVFIVVPDHGHMYPTEKYGMDMPERFHVPLFMFGGAIKPEYRGMKVNDVVSQTDVVATLASFVGDKSNRFKYSTNLFDTKRKHIAFYNSNSTYGVVTNDAAVGFDLQGRKVSYTAPGTTEEQKEHLLPIAKAYYQTVFKDFLKY